VAVLVALNLLQEVILDQGLLEELQVHHLAVVVVMQVLEAEVVDQALLDFLVLLEKVEMVDLERRLQPMPPIT
jgi:hypothetical protein